MSSIYSIYKATNTITGKSYIGFDSNWPHRLSYHKSHYTKQDYKFYRSIRKHGWENFHWEVIYQSKDKIYTLKTMESFFIKEYNSFHNGYNSTLGGDGTLGMKGKKSPNFGRKFSNEHKKNISVSKTGLKLSESHKEKISKRISGKNHPCYGKILLDETKLKISNSLKSNKKASEESSKRLKIIKQNTPKLQCMYCLRFFDPGNFKQHHGDRCKFKLTSDAKLQL